jgi:hypothetical protein
VVLHIFGLPRIVVTPFAQVKPNQVTNEVMLQIVSLRYCTKNPGVALRSFTLS